jgi:hypothetical protein
MFVRLYVFGISTAIGGEQSAGKVVEVMRDIVRFRSVMKPMQVASVLSIADSVTPQDFVQAFKDGSQFA